MREKIQEGSSIDLSRRITYFDKGKWHKGKISTEHITSGSETPRESFEKLFPKYQIAEYRSVDLGLQNSAFEDFFKFHRWSGLSISGVRGVTGTINSRDNRYMQSALRNPNKRNPEILGKEAIYILNNVILPLKHTYASGGLNLEDLRLTAIELSDAFESLKNKGIIRC